MVWVMNMDELKKRKTPRYQSFDYNSAGVYFITICTQNRRCFLSRIVGTGVPDCPHSPRSIVGTGVPDCPHSSRSIVGTGILDCPHPELTKYGQIADKYIKQLNDFYNHLSVEEYVIMPNHIHLLLGVKENKNAIENGQSRTPVPTIQFANILMRSPLSGFLFVLSGFCHSTYVYTPSRHKAAFFI